MNESPTKLRRELLAFWESREKNLVPLIGWRQDDCDYQPPRVVGGEQDFRESLAEQDTVERRQLNAPLVICWCLLGAFWCLATAAVAKIWS